MLIGFVLDKVNATNPAVIKALEDIQAQKAMGVEEPNVFVPYDYTIPMVIFAGFGVLALIFAFVLLAMDKKHHYGLELPNIQSKEAEAAEVAAAEE